MSASGQTLSRHRVFCGVLALLVVMLLRCGIGAMSLVSDTRDLNPYPDTAILAEEDSSEGETAVKHAGSKGLGALDADVRPSTIVVGGLHPTTRIEGQVAFILNGGLQGAVRPTGPPHAQA
jgi:hypothetical protein